MSDNNIFRIQKQKILKYLNGHMFINNFNILTLLCKNSSDYI